MLAVALGFLAVGFGGYALRRVAVARLPRERDHGHRERDLLAGAVDPDRRPDPARATPGRVRDAAGRDEPRDRDRRARRRLSAPPRAFDSSSSPTRSRSSPTPASWSPSCPSPQRSRVEQASAPGSYRDVLRHRVFMGFMALNAVFITAGMAQIELIAPYAKNEAGIERALDRRRLRGQHARDRARAAPDRATRRGPPADARAARRWGSSGPPRGCSFPSAGLWLAGVAAFAADRRSPPRSSRSASACTGPSRRRSSPISPSRACSAATWRCRPSPGRSASRSARRSAASCSRSRPPGSGSSPRRSASPRRRRPRARASLAAGRPPLAGQLPARRRPSVTVATPALAPLKEDSGRG